MLKNETRFIENSKLRAVAYQNCGNTFVDIFSKIPDSSLFYLKDSNKCVLAIYLMGNSSGSFMIQYPVNLDDLELYLDNKYICSLDSDLTQKKLFSNSMLALLSLGSKLPE